MPQVIDIEDSSRSVKSPRIYQFGDFQIDIVEETLRRKGEKLRMNRRTFNVLRVLVERPGQIISKQEFFDTVWADTFVSDNSLTVAMTTLRKVLEEDTKNPRFIENLRRKGYRFIGEVKVEIPTVDNTSVNTQDFVQPAPTAADQGRWSFKKRKVLVGASAAILFLLLTALAFNYRGGVISTDQSAIDSVAVLPFENNDPETEYLSDGLTESITNDLALLPNLRVISRHSVFLYKGKQTDAITVGRELNVRAVITGRLVQHGDDLTIFAELTDAVENKQLWARQYTHKAADAFSLQREVSRNISETLRTKLAGEIVKRETDSPEAFRLYLKGRYQWNKRTHEGFEKAIEFFKQAIEHDPAYAMPYLGLANCYLSLNFKYPVNMEERSAMVKGAAQRALEIDPQLGEAYATLAINSHFNEWDRNSAEQHYKKAVELSPNYATGHHWYAELLATLGRFDESFMEYRRALDLDPLSQAISTDLGMNYYYARQPDKAIEYLTRLGKIDANYFRTPTFLEIVYEEQGRFVEAIAERDKQYAIQKENAEIWERRKPILENAIKTSGRNGYWQTLLQFSMEDKTPNFWLMARCYSRLGDRDSAFAKLEKLYNDRSPLMVWLKVTPELDGLRSDPRFADLLVRVGVPL